MFKNVYQGKKVLVTGNTGFKGTWLTIWLQKLGAQVYGISERVPTTPSMFELCHLRDSITYMEHNVNDLAAITARIAEVKPDFVFHLAAQPIVKTAYDDPVGTMMTNIMGTAHVLEALRLSNHPCTAVMITSDKCYDNVEWVWGYRETDHLGGKDPYSASKGAAELMIKTYYHSFFAKKDSNVRLVSGRAGNVIGGGDWADFRLVPDSFRQWGSHQTLEIRAPRSTRPWQHVLEPLSGYLHAGEQLFHRAELNGETYNFGPSVEKSYSVQELLELLKQHWDFGDLQEPIRVIENPNFKEAGLLKLNCDKALYDLAWKATLNIEEVAEMTAAWYYEYYRGDQAAMLAVTNRQLTQYENLAAERKIAWALA
jgi:CDP-glucose 4,6-dehydratase